MLGLLVLGMEEVLVLIGDLVCVGDFFGVIFVYDLFFIEFIKMIKEMNDGCLILGKLIGLVIRFFVGGVFNFYVRYLKVVVKWMEWKIDVGVEYFLI